MLAHNTVIGGSRNGEKKTDAKTSCNKVLARKQDESK
jgi:hypothetical protein